MLLNTDIRWSLSTVKFMKISFQLRKEAGIGDGVRKERASYGTTFKTIALKAF